jgi:hypothetical protein
MPHQYSDRPTVGEIQVELRDRLNKRLSLKGKLSVILNYLKSHVGYSEGLEFQVYALLSCGYNAEIEERYIIRRISTADSIPTGV